MRRLFPLCCAVLMMSGLARASMWSDPDWKEMLKESELIALVEVIEGGKYVAKVRPLTVFQGEIGGEFYVIGFNNSSWPADAIETGSFRENQRYYLFLVRHERVADYLDSVARVEEGPLVRFIADGMSRIFGSRPSFSGATPVMKAAKLGLVWSVWSPSAGDLPVNGETVRYDLLQTSYPHGAPEHDRAEFDRFLRAAVAYQTGGSTDSALLNDAQQAIRLEAATKPVRPSASATTEREQPSNLSHWLGIYFLAGGRTYDKVFEGIAAGPDANARFMLARLLGDIAEEPARRLLLAMLEDDSTIV